MPTNLESMRPQSWQGIDDIVIIEINLILILLQGYPT